MSITRGSGFRHSLYLAQQIRLSLSQRERIKVRDCFLRVSPPQTKSLLAQYRVLHEPDDSKIGGRRSSGEQETLAVCDRVSGGLGNYVRHRLAQLPVWLLGNKNRGHKNEADAADEICSLRNFGSAGAAKERVPTWSDACADDERGSQRDLSRALLFWKAELPPHLNPLPLNEGRGGQQPNQRQTEPALGIQTHTSLPRWIGPAASWKLESVS